jgi:hypothetical protein
MREFIRGKISDLDSYLKEPGTTTNPNRISERKALKAGDDDESFEIEQRPKLIRKRKRDEDLVLGIK